jgi:acyl carrier protein
MTDIDQKVIAIIAKELNLKKLPSPTDELAKFDTDSLDRAEIIFSLEDEFGITLNIPDKETAIKIFTTVQGVIDFITEQMAEHKG